MASILSRPQCVISKPWPIPNSMLAEVIAHNATHQVIIRYKIFQSVSDYVQRFFEGGGGGM